MSKYFSKTNLLLITLIVLAFILRSIGLLYAFPLNVVYDESTILSASLKMLGTHTLRATAFQNYYPAGLSFLYLPFLVIFFSIARLLNIFNGVASLREAVLLQLGAFLPLARLISVLFGTSLVYLIYKITTQLFPERKIGLLAAWFAAVSFFLVADAHFGRTWTAQTLFITLVLYWAVKFYFQAKVTARSYFFGGFLVGLAFSINFVGLISYFWFGLAHFLKNKGQKITKIFVFNRNFWLANLVIFLIIPLVYYLNPFGFNNYFQRLTDTSLPVASGSGAYKIFSFLTLKNLWFYLQHSFIQEPLIFLLALAALIPLWRRQRPAFYFLALWPLVYYLLLSPQTTLMTRYTLPVMPALIIMAAYGVYHFWSKINAKKWILILLATIFALPTLIFSLLFDLRMTKPDTRVLAVNWLSSHLPSGASINATDVGTEFALTENKAALNLIKTQTPIAFSTSRKYLESLDDANYPMPNYFIIYDRALLPADHPLDFIVLADFDYSRLLNKTQALPLGFKLIQKIYPSEDLVNAPARRELQIPFNDATFSPLTLLRQTSFYGPYIEIYQLIPVM